MASWCWVRLKRLSAWTDVFKPLPDKRGLYRPTGARATIAPAARAAPKVAAIGRTLRNVRRHKGTERVTFKPGL